MFNYLSKTFGQVVLTISILCGTLGIIKAQQPVTGSLYLQQPYPTKWGQFADPILDKVHLTLNMSDNWENGSKTILLQFELQQGTSTISQTQSAYKAIKQFQLSPNIPLVFSSTDLSPYFQQTNITAVSSANYTKNFPEGIYRLIVRVYDATTQKLISDDISFQYWLIQNDPPILNSPRDDENITTAVGTPINFQWLPQDIQNTELKDYEFSLVQVTRTSETDPLKQFTTGTAVYTTTTNSTNLTYGTGAGQVPLSTGKVYAWRVRAKAKKADGTDLGMYKNDGYSNVFTFRYNGTCVKPIGLIAEAKSSEMILVTWAPQKEHIKYRVAYRKYSVNGQWDWFEQETTNSFSNINGLEPNTEYVVKVGGVCAIDMTTFSDSVRVKTLLNGEVKNVRCGDSLQLNITNQNPLASLKPFDIIRAGDFPVTLTEVNGGNGSFSGKGFISVPWIGTKLKVSFSGITVNTDTVLIAGTIKTEYDPQWKGIIDIDGIFEGGMDVGSVKTGEAAVEYSVGFEIASTTDIKVTKNNTTGGATLNIRGKNGETQIIKVSELPTSLKDGIGKIYGIDANGVVTLVGKQIRIPSNTDKFNNIETNKATVTFLPAGLYAFDTYDPTYDKDIRWKSKYEKLGSYRVSNKASAPGKPDIVKVQISVSDNTLNPDSINFISGKGISYEKKSLGGGNYEIRLVGAPGGDAQELYALYPTSVEEEFISLGKLFIPSYTIQKKKLALVPVNGATVNQAAIAQSLKDIYEPICVQWDVTVKDNFTDITWDINGDGKMQIDETGFWSTQTLEMKKLKNNYAQSRGVDEKTIYQFLLNEANVAGVLGDMPRAKQFGFVFVNGNTQINRTVAHEIGHGVLQLKHTFDTRYNFAQEDLSNNLMNYGQGVSLSKYQWDAIHDPGIVIGAFDKDEDVQNHFVDKIDVKFLNYMADTDTIKYFSFLSPNGKIVSIPNYKNHELDVTDFAYGALYNKTTDANFSETFEIDLYNPNFRYGTLDRFAILKNSERIVYAYNFDSKSYRINGTGDDYVDNAPIEAIKGFVFPMPCGKDFTLYKFPVTNIPKYTAGGENTDFNFIANLKFFSDERKPMKEGTTVLKQNTVSTFIPDANTVTMLSPYCELPQLLYVLRIAQIRQAYPEYFKSFTQTDGNWLIPQISSEVPSPSTAYPQPTRGPWASNNWLWGKKLEIEYKVTPKSDYPKLFLNDFVINIDEKIVKDLEFWENLTVNTSWNEILAYMQYAPMLKIIEAPLEKREIAFETLLEKGFYSETQILRLLHSVLPMDESSRKHFLDYVVQNITIKSFEEKYRGWYPNEQYSLVMIALSSLIEPTKAHKEAFKKATGYPDATGVSTKDRELVKIDADLIRNSNSRFTAIFNSDNTITFRDKVNNSDLLTNVPYDEFIPIEFLTPLDMMAPETPNVRSSFARGLVEPVPAIYAAALLQQQSASLFSKKSWLAYDGVTMLLGVGELNMAIKAGSWLRRAVAITDIVGSTISIAAQLSSDNTLAPEVKQRIQITSAILQAPAAIRGISEIFLNTNRVADEVFILSQSNALPQQTRSRLLQFYEKITGGAKSALEAQDAANIKNAAVFLEGAEAERVIAALSKIQNK